MVLGPGIKIKGHCNVIQTARIGVNIHKCDIAERWLAFRLFRRISLEKLFYAFRFDI